jgi:hypothetical protein
MGKQIQNYAYQQQQSKVDLRCGLDATGVQLEFSAQLPAKFCVTFGEVQVRPFLQAFVEKGFSLFWYSISF